MHNNILVRISFVVIFTLALSLSSANAQGNVNTVTVPAAGAALLRTDGLGGLLAGYARVSGDGINPLPPGQVIFGLSQGGVLISETAVPGTATVTGGRIYAEINGPIQTGLAIANPNPQQVVINYKFTDPNGTDVNSGSFNLSANSQKAFFLNEPTLSSFPAAPFRGTFTFQSPLPVAAIALKGFVNERSEFLMTTLPVIDLGGPVQNQSLLLPYYADSGGWSTETILVNSTDFPMSGTIQFSGQITLALADGITSTTRLGVYNYFIQPRSSRRVASVGTDELPHVGWIQIVPVNTGGTPSSVSITPSAVSIFSFKNGAITVTQAGVPAVPLSNAFRVYVESSGDFNNQQRGSVQSGIALSNPGISTATATFELFMANGVSTGLKGTMDLVANQESPMFLGQIPGFSSLPNPFRGVLRVTVPTGFNISMVGLRGRYNERGDFLIATTPPVIEGSPAGAQYFFPHLANGGGYVTQFIWVNNDLLGSHTMSLTTMTQAGGALPLNLLN